MMKKQVPEGIRYHKRKLLSAFIMVLIAAVLVVASTFAWLTMSSAPEVTGIDTNIGANGSLEIALLNSTTHNDLTAISTRVGDSFEAQGIVASNLSWGNIVNLSDPYYGLSEITLMPSQLLITNSGEGYNVNPNGPLAMPSYGTDGRIIELNTNSVSAVYSANTFSLSENQTYGVRAIGTSDATSSSANMIGLAKSYVTSYSGGAKSAAINAISNNGAALINILMTHETSASATFNDANISSLKTMLNDMKTTFAHIETSVRYGMFANVLQTGTESATSAASFVLNKNNSLSAVIDEYPAVFAGTSFADKAAKLTNAQNIINTAYTSCVALQGNNYTWEQIQPILEPLLSMNNAYIDGEPFSQIDINTLLNAPGFTMSMLTGSGVFAEIADFCGDYSAWLNFLGKSIELQVRTTYDPTLLVEVRNTITDDPGTNVSAEDLEISNLGGYAIDLAFRCNAPESDLQLQIAPEQRIYKDSASTDLQGGGSYMQFSNEGGTLTTGQMIELMDAIRVTFVDINGDVLAMAKLNMSNRTLEENGSVKAYLYLYKYTLAVENGYNKVVIGERRSGDVKITELTQNVAKAVTAIVWIDGNLVDNTMVSATTVNSLNGVLNLQFSSSADLVPASNGILYNSNASKTDLNELVGSYGSLIAAGNKGVYTADSWNAFSAAYAYADAVLDDLHSSPSQVKAAYNGLVKAHEELVEVTHEELLALINDVRSLTGTSSDVAGYALGGQMLSTFTAEQKDAGTPVYAVVPENNIHDEGNGVQTPVYDRVSWTKLAIALYDAEAVNANAAATEGEISGALTELELAYTMLDRPLHYEAYDFNGTIYYRAITDETDTYGKWYDADFNRVISDLKILDLDSAATVATVAAIEAPKSYEIGSGAGIAARIDLSKNAYPRLADDEVIGIRWGISGAYNFDLNDDSRYDLTQTLNTLVSEANELKEYEEVTNKDALTEGVTTANSILDGTAVMTDGEIAEFVNSFAGAVETAKAEHAQKIDNDAAAAEAARTDINADEQSVLAAAILEAEYRKAAFESEEKDLPEGFDEKLAAARAVQNKADAATKAEFETALGELNAKIEAAGGTPKTAYNVIKYTIAHDGDYTEGINRIVNPTAVINPDEDEYGTVYLTARILTKNGVVYTASTSVIFYNRPESIEIVENGSVYSLKINNKKVNVGTENEKYLICNENPIEYSWSLQKDDPESTLALSSLTGSTVEITGEGSGTLRLTVKMNTGNEYIAQTSVNY